MWVFSLYTRFSNSKLHATPLRFLSVLFQKRWGGRTDIHICVSSSLECTKWDGSHSPCHQESILLMTDHRISENVSLISSVTNFATCRRFPQERVSWVNAVWPDPMWGILLHPQLVLRRWKTGTHPKILPQMSGFEECWIPSQEDATKRGDTCLSCSGWILLMFQCDVISGIVLISDSKTGFNLEKVCFWADFISVFSYLLHWNSTNLILCWSRARDDRKISKIWSSHLRCLL